MGQLLRQVNWSFKLQLESVFGKNLSAHDEHAEKTADESKKIHEAERPLAELFIARHLPAARLMLGILDGFDGATQMRGELIRRFHLAFSGLEKQMIRRPEPKYLCQLVFPDVSHAPESEHVPPPTCYRGNTDMYFNAAASLERRYCYP